MPAGPGWRAQIYTTVAVVYLLKPLVSHPTFVLRK